MRLLAAAAVFSLALSAAAHAAGPVAIQGSVVSLTPPPGFAPAKDFAGLTGRGASVHVADMEGAFDEIASALTPANAAAQGFKIVRREDLKDLPFKAALFTATTTVGGKAADKWLLIVERPGGVSLLNAVAVRGGSDLTDAAAHALARSVRLSAVTNADPTAGLGFTLTAPSALTYRQPVAQTGLTMTAEAPTADNAGRPALMVGAVFQQPVAFKDRVAAFAYALSNMQTLKLEPSGAPNPIKVGDLDALQAALTGQDAAGRRVEALATLVFAPAKAYLILGTATPAAYPAIEPGFKAATASFKLKP